MKLDFGVLVNAYQRLSSRERTLVGLQIRPGK